MGKGKAKGKTNAQKIVDVIAPRYAKWQGLTMNTHYWNDPNFSKWYVSQIRAANSLLRLYDIKDIVNALNYKDNLWMSSLRCNGLINDIKIEKINREKSENVKRVTVEKVVEEDYTPTNKKKNNKLDKLR